MLVVGKVLVILLAFGASFFFAFRETAILLHNYENPLCGWAGWFAGVAVGGSLALILF